MEKGELICIDCPIGCLLTVGLEGGEILNITGYTCRRGKVYIRKEVTNPTRTVTSTADMGGGRVVKVSIKTRGDIPKEKIFRCVKALEGITAKASVHIGDMIIANVADTGVDIIATRDTWADNRQPPLRWMPAFCGLRKGLFVGGLCLWITCAYEWSVSRHTPEE